MKKIENLTDTRPADPAQARQFRLIGDGAALEKPLEANGQSHEPSQARHPACVGGCLIDLA
jgi:hypothetical protein